jgi:hypothetical protein
VVNRGVRSNTLSLNGSDEFLFSAQLNSIREKPGDALIDPHPQYRGGQATGAASAPCRSATRSNADASEGPPAGSP